MTFFLGFNKAHSSYLPKYALAFLIFSLIQKAKKRSHSLRQFQTALDLSKVLHFPPHHVKWFTSEAWNNGIYFYKLSQPEKAKPWLDVALCFSSHLPDQDELRLNIVTTYDVIMAKLNQ